MIIYRLEDEEGLGPFVTGLAAAHDLFAIAAAKRGYETLDPAKLALTAPAHEQGLNHTVPITLSHIFGCSSIEQLQVWWPSPVGCGAMANAGVLLALYSAPDEHVLVDRSCVAFVKKYSRRFATYPASELHEYWLSGDGHNA